MSLREEFESLKRYIADMFDGYDERLDQLDEVASDVLERIEMLEELEEAPQANAAAEPTNLTLSVGDRVRVVELDDVPGNGGLGLGMQGVIIELQKETADLYEGYRVEFVDGSRVFMFPHEVELVKDEPVSTFGVGDLVKFQRTSKEPYDMSLVNGMIGVIRHDDGRDYANYAVEFAGFEGHTAGGYTPRSNGQWVSAEDLELA